MSRRDKEKQEIWIIGCGDPHHGDDGIGPYMVGALKKGFVYKEGVYFRCVSNLTPGLINDLQHAAVVIFVEATVERLKKGWRLLRVVPDLSFLPFLKHHATPEYLLGLLESVYKRRPSMWLVSVQGYDFGLEEEFYPEAEKNMEVAISFVYYFVKNLINRSRKYETNRHLSSGMN